MVHTFQFVERTSDVLYTAQILDRSTTPATKIRLQESTLGGLKARVLQTLAEDAAAQIDRVDNLFNRVAETVRDS